MDPYGRSVPRSGTDPYGRSLRSRAAPAAAQDSMVSLLHLEPSPMDPTASMLALTPALPPMDEDDDDETSPPSSRSRTFSSPSTPHGPLFYLSRVQKYSTYTITAFVSIHLATTSVIPLLNSSVAASESALLLAREIYQTPTTEPLLVALPVVAHVVSGLAMRVIRRSQNMKRYGSAATPGLWAQHSKRESATTPKVWPRLSWISASGYAFAFFMGAHVVVNRLLPVLVEGNSSSTGLAFVAHGFARHGARPWVAYAGLLGFGCGHMVWGWAKWVGLAPVPLLDVVKSKKVEDKASRRRRRKLWWGTHAVSALSAGMWAAGGLGVVAKGGASEGWVGKLYDEMYGVMRF